MITTMNSLLTLFSMVIIISETCIFPPPPPPPTTTMAPAAAKLSIINLTDKAIKIKIEWENSSVCPNENFEIEAFKVTVVEYLSKCGKLKKINATDCGTRNHLHQNRSDYRKMCDLRKPQNIGLIRRGSHSDMSIALHNIFKAYF